MGAFDGFPRTTQFVQKKFEEISLLRNFKTVEQCSLEYDPERGASIDPHIDDCWIWGERIITVNVLGDSVLTMTPYRGPITRYNLDFVSNYSSILANDVCHNAQIVDIDDNMIVRLPMPARSLMILYGPARYNILFVNIIETEILLEIVHRILYVDFLFVRYRWEHSVFREDITSRRVCLAYRELTPPYLENGEHYAEASEILRQASFFW